MHKSFTPKTWLIIQVSHIFDVGMFQIFVRSYSVVQTEFSISFHVLLTIGPSHSNLNQGLAAGPSEWCWHSSKSQIYSFRFALVLGLLTELDLNLIIIQLFLVSEPSGSWTRILFKIFVRNRPDLSLRDGFGSGIHILVHSYIFTKLTWQIHVVEWFFSRGWHESEELLTPELLLGTEVSSVVAAGRLNDLSLWLSRDNHDGFWFHLPIETFIFKETAPVPN